MPTLLETQQAIYRGIIACDDEAAERFISANGISQAAGLAVYRNGFVGALTTALRLSFPAVHRLVGTPFFESAARIFIEGDPPRSAWLDEYGASFPRFVAEFPPSAALAYLSEVARLEWAVGRALHANDADPIDVTFLATMQAADHARLRFLAHPSVGFVHATYPVDAIWRAVLAEDDVALGEIDLDAGPVWLQIQRRDTGLDVRRLGLHEWLFSAAVCNGWPLQAAIDAVPKIDAPSLLAAHFASGSFVGFEFADEDGTAPSKETSP